ncbi:phosphoribosylaminoimidazolesuccinocarboxamide synthase [Synechococcus elongatus]|uniref:phosphoribosylaminoimidazolesuccinocarboxamide synthase n=1 Tax=Synechococcus elongatus TaxID=32046 RepID=UPI0030D50BCB
MSAPLYEGKAKIVYATDDPQVYRTYFKDDATAFNAQKRGQISGKGAINCAVSSYLFRVLAQAGVTNHFIEQISEREMNVQAVEIVPLEVVVRNLAAGSLCKQTGLAEGTAIVPPLVEFYLKNDALGDPLLTPDRLRLLKIATEAEVQHLQTAALQVNALLQTFFNRCGITLVDFKLEFGRDRQGQILLADEISPDTCRLWDQQESDPEKRILDKDRFRRDLGDVEAAYARVLDLVAQQAQA